MTTDRQGLVSLVSRRSHGAPYSTCNFKGESNEPCEPRVLVALREVKTERFPPLATPKTRSPSLSTIVGLSGLMVSPLYLRGNRDAAETTVRPVRPKGGR